MNCSACQQNPLAFKLHRQRPRQCGDGTSVVQRQLGFPTLYSNQLELDSSGRIVNYHMRMQNQKKHSDAALKTLNFFTMAATRLATVPLPEAVGPSIVITGIKLVSVTLFQSRCAIRANASK